MEEGVTHVVAAKDGTDKCLAARKIPGCVLVKASWLVECFWSMSLCDVTPHLLDARTGVEESATSSTTNSTKLPLQDSKVDNFTGTEASDDTSSTGSLDDDDFAATLEDEMMNS